MLWRRPRLTIGITAAVLSAAVIGIASGTPSARTELAKATSMDPPRTAPSRIVNVTVYQNNALVTREVDVPEATGPIELIVNLLPPQTVNSSLYSEGDEGIRVLTTRYRTRPMKEDAREEVRKVEAQLKVLQQEGQQLQSEMRAVEQNQQLLSKLENFTGANLQHQTEKGTLNSESILALSKYVMDGRVEKAQALVALQQKIQDNQEQLQFAQRQLQDLAARSNKTERDAVIVVDKQKAGPGKVRLNYLVDSASWRPQYKFRADKKEDQPIELQYLAAVVQQTGEDWNHVNLILSTAQPMLSSSPPELKLLDVAVVSRSGGNGANPPPNQPMAGEYARQARQLRAQAQKDWRGNKEESANTYDNQAAALEQARDLLAVTQEELKHRPQGWSSAGAEGPSVTYHLNTPLTVPSRNDEQILEVARIDMAPEYYYKAVPVLTPHVYRLANLTNKSQYVLLPGEATMYIGTDFVGRASQSLVAIGEQFTAGFGVDPQLQVQRQLMDKTRTTQGDNQVLRYEYRLLLSSYKSEPVKAQVWDRLPHGEAESIGVSLVKAAPEVSNDALYLRENRPNNLLRWDLTLDPTMNGEKARAITYEFKLELGRQTMISNFLTR